MTLQQIVDFTTRKTGVTELEAREEAADYAAARWAMIWNHAIWRQSRHHDTVTVPAGEAVVELPPEFDLVHAIRIGGVQMLQPSLDIDALFMDPAGRDQPGTPSSFAVMGKSSAGRVRIRLHRPPSEPATLLVIGKLPFPPLVNPTDTPMGIPGVVECLIAYVLGDLQQGLRQYAKANEHFTEAAALLAKAVEIETHQNADVRRLIPTPQMLECDVDNSWM